MDINKGELEDSLIAALFLMIGVYAYWEAQTFSGKTDLWPRLLAVSLVVLSLLVLVRDWLPGPLLRFMSEQTEIAQVNHEFEESEAEMELTQTDVKRPIPDTIFTVLAICSYIAIAYLFGFLWASPVFVAVYLLWFEIRLVIVVTLSVTSYAIAYAFMKLLYLPLDKGAIFGGF